MEDVAGSAAVLQVVTTMRPEARALYAAWQDLHKTLAAGGAWHSEHGVILSPQAWREQERFNAAAQGLFLSLLKAAAS